MHFDFAFTYNPVCRQAGLPPCTLTSLYFLLTLYIIIFVKTNATQIIILGIFILFLIVGVLVFSKFSGSTASDSNPIQIQVWGTVPDSTFSNLVQSINSTSVGAVNVAYTEVQEDVFEQTLIEALADGVGPDVVLIPNTLLLKNQKKFTLIGNDILSTRDFKDTFIEGSEFLLTSKGTYGIPFYVDPLVMYWNRDILTSKNVARPPTTWEEILLLASTITERRDDRSIIKSTVALGDYSNVQYAKEILLSLVMQSGGSFVGRDSDDRPINLLDGSIGGDRSDFFTSAMSFFTQFSDPLKPVYSWNRSLPKSQQAFINGDLAFYFGYASDAFEIRAKNPNLNFDIADFPQPKNSPTKVSAGTIYSFSILATSQNQNASYINILALAGQQSGSILSSISGLPSARRDLLSLLPGTSFGDVFWRSALRTRAWLDPNPIQTGIIFANSVNDAVTGKSKSSDAARLASRQITELLR